MKSRSEAAAYAKKCVSLANRGLSNQRKNSDLCDAFLVGDYMELSSTVKGKPVQFSKPLPYINAVNGFFVQTRSKAKYVAMIEEQQDQVFYSKSSNALREYVRRNNRADQVETRQDRHMLVKGYGAVATAMTYDKGFATRDPNGEILKEDVTDYCFWDPMARQPNLLDRRFDGYRKSYPLDEAKELFDTSDDTDFESEGTDNNRGFKYDPTIYPYDRSKIEDAAGYDWESKEDRTVWVNFFEWYEVETFYKAENPIYKIQNPQIQEIAKHRIDAIEAQAKKDGSMFQFENTAQQITFDGETKKLLEKEFGDAFKAYPYKRKVYYSAVTSGNKCFDLYESPSQYSFWMGFKTGYWDAKNRIWYGMVNPMMEPTKYSNTAFTNMLMLIARTAKGGYFFEKGAIEGNVQEFENNVTRTDRNVEVAEGALQGGKIQPKAQPANFAGYDAILQASNAAFTEMAGIDPSFMGNSASGNDSAMLFRQKVRQVNSTLACYADSIEAYQEEDARMELDFFRIYAENNEGGLVRLLGQQGEQQFMQISQDVFAQQYDVTIEEAPITPEEKAEQAQTLIQMGQTLASLQSPAALPCFSGAIELLPIEQEVKQGILQAMQPPAPDPQAQAMQQQATQLQLAAAQAALQKTQGEVDLMKAKVEQIMVANEKTDAQVGLTAAQAEEAVASANQTKLENALLPLKTIADVKVQVTA